jgi:putative hemolysin
MNRQTILVIIMIIVVILGGGYILWKTVLQTPEAAAPSAGIANPASTYCLEEMKGQWRLYESEAGQIGYCLLPDNRLCEEWQLFNSKGEKCAAPKADERPANQ